MARIADGTYETLRVRVERGVAHVTIDHPPLNLLDKAMMLDLHYLTKALPDDDTVRVALFESANPEFFVAHADLEMLLETGSAPPRDAGRLNIVQDIGERLRTMPVVSIAKIEGRARGGGSELVLAMDMRFGARGRAILGQPEAMLGLIPGGGGTQRLPRLVGRSRAMEIVLGCDDFDADLAERYGYINRALPPEELGPFVERLAYRIAAFPREALARTKRAALLAEKELPEDLIEENRLFDEAVRFDAAERLMRRCLELGGQTRDGELNLADLAEDLAD